MGISPRESNKSSVIILYSIHIRVFAQIDGQDARIPQSAGIEAGDILFFAPSNAQPNERIDS